jgi:hypothetical protein
LLEAYVAIVVVVVVVVVVEAVSSIVVVVVVVDRTRRCRNDGDRHSRSRPMRSRSFPTGVRHGRRRNRGRVRGIVERGAVGTRRYIGRSHRMHRSRRNVDEDDVKGRRIEIDGGDVVVEAISGVAFETREG